MEIKNQLSAIFIFLAASAIAQTTLNVLTTDSKVTWTGTKVVGYHQGTIIIREGKITLKDQRLTGGYFVIDMNTITCTDIPDTDPIPKKRLENHLKGADFFNVAEFPTAKFEIAEVLTHPDNPAKYLVRGNLSVKGITKGWKVEVEPITQTENLFIAQADLRFDRQQFGVSYKGFADELVHDMVRLNIILKAR